MTTPPDLSKCDVFASVSGGKDSAAMCLLLKERGIPYRAVFADTGWEHADTYTYLREVLEHKIGPIAWVRSEVVLEGKQLAMAEELEAMLGHYSAMVRWCLKKAMFSSRKMWWCTPSVKTIELDSYLNANSTGEAVNAQGVRRGESKKRATLDEWEFSEDRDLWVWRPLIAWSYDDVIAMHTKHGLAPNPLYLRGADRVGCWPCMNAVKAEIKRIADLDPVRIDVLRKLEGFVAELARERHEAKGKEQIHTDPTWFQSQEQVTLEDGRTGYHFSIDDVVLWSRTARGGRQFELFSPIEEPGCVRWGLCEAPLTRRS